MIYVLYLFIMVFLIEATTNIVSKSKIFEPLRKYLNSKSENRYFRFLYNIISCPYCTSVWMSFFYVGMLWLYINSFLPLIITLFFAAIFLHRWSNILHFIIDRLDTYHGFIPEE